ncbi:MAG: preprotein translocase subunit SecG [Candidatus Pacebacteria bacterium]|nr:preprotein translocase subunit SecG [Candidatus Paceibacterota bacterium]
MENLSNILPYIQIVLAVFLTVSVLLQQSEGGLGGAFGGSDDFSGTHTRRGFEKILFNTTIVLGILFVAAAFLALII